MNPRPLAAACLSRPQLLSDATTFMVSTQMVGLCVLAQNPALWIKFMDQVRGGDGRKLFFFL